jgi:hypothetical protein
VREAVTICISSPLPRRFDAGDGRDIGPRIVTIIGERGVRRLQRCDSPIEATFCAEAWEIGDFRTWPGERRDPAGHTQG